MAHLVSAHIMGSHIVYNHSDFKIEVKNSTGRYNFLKYM